MAAENVSQSLMNLMILAPALYRERWNACCTDANAKEGTGDEEERDLMPVMPSLVPGTTVSTTKYCRGWLKLRDFVLFNGL